MSLIDLFDGIAVVIDDEIDTQGNIESIIKQIQKNNLPLLIYKELPNTNIVKNLKNISFLLFDWNLKALDFVDIQEGVKIPNKLQKAMELENIKFLKSFFEISFCPVFIFSNENCNAIKNLLIKNSLYFEDRPNRIFIKQKSELIADGSFFCEIEKWMKNTPSIYVLKEWDKSYKKSIIEFFNDFQKLNPYWPLVMWKCYQDDDVNANQSLELADLLVRNVHTRMRPFEFCRNIFEMPCPSIGQEDLRKILEGERFLPKKNLHEDDIGTGDLFRFSGSYFLNIRAQCDLVRNGDVLLYCVTGKKLTKPKETGSFTKARGEFEEKVYQAVVPFIAGGQIVVFSFKKLEIKQYNEIKEKRIGRLLPPYITRVQQRFALYMQRQGLPRIPEAAIFPTAETDRQEVPSNAP
jgi:hypothetical protein